jgi:hypothetical protein
MPRSENYILKQMIADTDAEILAEALGDRLDNE